MSRLFFGDKLGWLRDTKEFHDASVDLETPFRMELPEPVERGRCQDMDSRAVEKRPRW